jgi:PAS domain S-box-containing protein
LLGYESIDQLMRTNISDDIYVDRMDRERLITKYWQGQVVDGAQVRWKARDGRHLIVRLYGHVVDGPEPSFDASVLDVTDLEATNAELRRQREEIERTATTLDMVVRQVSAIWWLCDRDLRLLRTGGAVMELLGYAPDTYVGWKIADVVADPDHPAIAAHQRALEGHVSHYTSEYRGKQFDHTIAPHRVDGEIIGVIGTNIDVTTSRALERRMVDAQRAESLGVLAGGLAHDFNNLLVAILGNADLGLRDTVAGAPGSPGSCSRTQVAPGCRRHASFRSH